MDIKAFYQANILGKENSVFIAPEGILLNGEMKVPAKQYFSIISAPTPNDSDLDTEDVDQEVIVSEQSDYAVFIGPVLQQVFHAAPLVMPADTIIAGAWKLAGTVAQG